MGLSERVWKSQQQEMDFVIGIEIRLSDNHPCDDICDDLAGVYPKKFKFTGWHPFCCCYTIPKLAEREELNKWARMSKEERAGYHFKGEVRSMPKKFTDWVKRNEKRIKSAKSLPYFIKDNFSYHAISKYIEVKSSKTLVVGGGNPLEPLTKIQRKKYDSINTPTGVNDDSLSSVFVKGKPMPHGEANKGNVNPGFSLEKDGLNNNCACCVMAYVARRNGYNVRAAMRNNELLEDLASHPEKAWIRADKTTPKFKRAGGVDNNIKEKIVIKNRAQMLEEFEILTQKRRFVSNMV